MASPTKVCVIGAGPSGLLSLYRFLQLGEHCPEIICYEKQATWGGQWNPTWRTSTDIYGEPVHSSIYNNLWTNIPKETMEIPEYTFDEHFGKTTPSYISVPVLRSYLEGLMKKCRVNLEDSIQYNTIVRSVRYDSSSDSFSVQVTHLPTGRSQTQAFSHVVVANGIFSLPFVPDIEGIDTFDGLILHSHLVKNSEMFRNKRVLIIGSLYSAEDIAIHGQKYGAKKVIIAYRNHKRNFNWPAKIEERPMVTRFTNNTVAFKDGSLAEIDLVIMCTGYMYQLDFLEDDLRLEEVQTSLYPDNLYKGVQWLKGGNRKLFYIGYQMTVYSIPTFDVQAVWVVEYVTGRSPFNMTVCKIQNKTKEEMKSEVDSFRKELTAVKTEDNSVDFMTKYSTIIAGEVGYKIDFHKYSEILKRSLASKPDHMMTYRDGQYTSMYTKKTGTQPKVPWAKQFNNDIEAFLK